MEELKRCETRDNRLTLHEAIKNVIERHGCLSTREIARIINEQELYSRGDRLPVPANQISARVRNYPDMFIVKDRKVYLRCGNDVLYIYFSIERHPCASRQIEIDLRDGKAVYCSKGEYSIIGGYKKVKLNQDTIDKLRLMLKEIHIFRWKRVYSEPILDGTSWSLRIITREDVFESNGFNAYPKEWREFRTFFDSLFMDDLK